MQIQRTDFSDLIARFTADFVGRTRLAERIDEALADPTCRFVVFTGGPGVGKTAFMAHLAKTHPNWLRYFIRSDSRDLLRSGDAKTFLLTVGTQLATLEPRLFKPENLKIVVHQRIGSVAEDGVAVAARIEELRASPFYLVALDVEQEIEHVDGHATALHIEHLSTTPRLLELQDLQHMSLLDPVRLLSQTDPAARVVILVDAIDELRYSPADPNVLRALCELPTDAPSNLKFVISSRPEADLNILRDRADVRWIVFDPTDEENQADLRAYLERIETDLGLGAALATAGLDLATFKQELLAKAAGNFLYLLSVLSSISAVLADPAKHSLLQRHLSVEALPEDLDSLYAYFLDSIVRWVNGSNFGKAAWRQYLSPLLGTLTVTHEPLTQKQLVAFTGLKLVDVRDLLRDLRQFIETEEVKPPRYRIFHTSFAEFVTNAEHNNDYWVDPSAAHKRIVDYYRERCNGEWPALAHDDYAPRYLATHMAEADDRTSLYTLINRPWMQAKLAATASHWAFTEDVLVAIDTAFNDQPPNLLQLIRTCFIDTSLRALSSNALPEAVGLLARLGKSQLARDIAASMDDPKRQSTAYYQIAQALLSSNEISAGRAMLDLGVRAARTISDPVFLAQALGEAAVVAGQAGDRHWADQLADQAMTVTSEISKGKEQTLALSYVACSLARLGDAARAQPAAERAATAARAWKLYSNISNDITILASSWDEGMAEAQQGVPDRAWQSALPKAEVLLRSAEVVLNLGDKQAARELIDEAQAEIPRIRTAEERALVFAQAAALLATLGEPAGTKQAVDRAFDIIGSAPPCVPDQLGLIPMSIDGSISKLPCCYNGDELLQARMFAKVTEAMARIGQQQAVVESISRVLPGVQVIQDPAVRAEALGWLAISLDQAGEATGALQIATQALATTLQLGGNLWKLRVPIAAAEACVEIQDRQCATELALAALSALKLGTIPPQIIDRAIDRAITTLARTQDANVVLTFLQSQGGDWDAIEIARWTVRAMIAQGNAEQVVYTIDNATGLTEQIPDPLVRTGRLLEMVQMLVAGQQADCALAVLNQALAATQAIEDTSAKIRVLCAIGRNFVELGHVEQAFLKAQSAYTLAQTLQDPGAKVAALASSALALAQAGDYEQAEAAARAIAEIERDIYTKMFGAISRNTLQTLVNIGKIMAQAHEFELALNLTQKELGYAENSSAKEELLEVIVREMGQERPWVQAQEVAAQISNPSRRSRTLSELSVIMAQAGKWEEAQAIAQEINVLPARMSALCQIASLLARASKWEQALRLVDQIEGPPWKARALSNTALALAGAGNQRAVGIAQEVQELARHIASACDRANLLSQVAQIHLEAGDAGMARTILADAIRTGCQGGRDCMLELLENCTNLLAKLERGETLIRIYDAMVEVETWWS